jgi:hypothetical protein
MKYFIGQRWRRMTGDNNEHLEFILEIVSVAPLKYKVLFVSSNLWYEISKEIGKIVRYGSEVAFIGEGKWYFPLKNQDAMCKS